MKKIAVFLSGCGVQDGAEIHEAVSTLLAIRQQGAQYQCYAPDRNQYHVINHCTGEEMPETRNILIESARIARGEIKPLSEFSVDDCDALILPGGFGAAKNLCDFAVNGTNMEVSPDVVDAVQATYQAKKPIGALCIAPVILAKLIKESELTIGSEPNVAQAIDSLGAKHQVRGHGEVVVDRAHRLVSSPCYMLDATIDQVYQGASNTVKAVLEMLES